MPKILHAVTNIKVGQDPDQFFAAGSPIDTSKFTAEQLITLHDSGAVEIRTVDESPLEVATIEEVVEKSTTSDKAAETEAPTPAPVAAPVKATTPAKA